MKLMQLFDPATIAGIGTFITAGIGALIAKRADSKVQSELSPNSGGSIKDQIDLVVSMVKSQGHQIGELKTELDYSRKATDNAINELTSRVERLENRRFNWFK